MSLDFTPDYEEIERRIEALLFAAAAPLSREELSRRLPEGADVSGALTALQQRYAGRGVELDCVAGRYRFRTAEDLGFLMTEEREEPRRLSKAALETLAVIAYRQPISRASVAQIRAVNVDSVVRTLLGRGLITEAHTDPETGAINYRTTEQLLVHLGINSLDELPPVSPLLDDGTAGFDEQR